MRKILLLLLLLFPILSTLAFKEADIQRLKTTCSCPGCDFSFANLAELKIGDIKTLVLNKAKKDERGNIICDLQQANFQGANLTGAFFSLGDFAKDVEQKVTKVLISRANFSRANLSKAHFNAIMADGADFSHANLANVSILKGTSMRQVNFNHANLDEIIVSPPMGGCGADFTGSHFQFANLSDSRLIADFTKADFSFANLTNAQLVPCDVLTADKAFVGTNFSNADLRGATFHGQVLTESILKNARLCRTKLSRNVISNRDCQF